MFQLPQTPQSILKIFDNSLKLFGLCFISVLPLSIGVAGLSILPSLLIPELNATDPQTLLKGLEHFFIYMPLYVGGMLIFYTAILYQLGLSIQGKEIDNWLALQYSVGKLIPLFIALWIYIFVVSIGYIVIIPGVILTTSLAFFWLIIVFEDEGVLIGLKRSHWLVWGHWWRTTTVLSLPIFLSVSVGLLAAFMVEKLLSSTHIGSTQTVLLIQAAYNITTSLMSPLFSAIMLLQYHDLKLRTGHYFSDSSKDTLLA